MQKTTKWTGLGVAGALTAAALVVPGLAVAQTGDATDEAPVTERHAEHEPRRHAFIDALADELGISAEELADAFANVRADMREERLADLRARLDAKVEAGELTQAEADAMYERAENGESPFGRHDRPRGRFGDAADARDADVPDATVEGTSTAA